MHKILMLVAKINKDSFLKDGWMLLFAAGLGEIKNEGEFLVDKAAFDLMTAHIADQGNEIVFDYEHQTLEGVEAPASGWFKEFAWEDGVGIKARVDWTDKAADYLAKDEYRYFSPVFFIRKSDLRVCGLHSSALTNTPKTKHLTPILAKLELGMASETNEEETMDREKLIASLGLKKDATDEQIMAAVVKLGVKLPEAKTKEVVSKDIIAALDLETTDGETEVVASIHALKQTSKTSVSLEEFNKLKTEIADTKASDAVVAAMEKGKVTPDQKDWALDYAKTNLKGFETYVAKAPTVVPIDELPGKKKKVNDGKLSDETLAVAKMMDVSKEDIKTHGDA
ncbi:MAG: phage protease [Desulfobacula sp.]|nr:phage protease [Desulfobacula sp.]